MIFISFFHLLKYSFRFSTKNPHPLSTSGVGHRLAVGFNEVVIISTDLTCGSHHSLQLHEIKFAPEKSTKLVKNSDVETSLLEEDGIILDADGIYTVNTAVIPIELGSDLCLTKVKIMWSRIGSKDIVTTMLSTSSITVEQPPVTIKLETPDKAKLGEPFDCVLILSNHTSRVQELVTNFAPDGTYIFCGFQNNNIHLQPFKTVKQSFKLIPTTPGFQNLPVVSINSIRYKKQLMHPDDNKEIFVSN